jgi:hypothetical protein
MQILTSMQSSIRNRRDGVSLLEVLFAMGAIAIGLLGVVAIFPLALNQVGQGVVVDRARQAGVNAIERFTTHGMNRPDQWVWYDRIGNRQAVGHPRNLNTKRDTATPTPQPSFEHALLPDGANTGFLIDPQFVAANGNTNGSGADARLFPYYSRGWFPSSTGPYPPNVDPRLRRISIGRERDSTTATTPPAMSAAHAASIFTGLDELVFNTPEEANLSPVQEFGSAGPGGGTSVSPISPVLVPSGSKRQYQGRISWVATLVPEIDVTNQSGTPSDLYLLSIVLFNARDNSFSINPTNERIVEVEFLDPKGLGGGDVNLTAVALDPIGHLELKRGNWILLMSTAHPATPVPSATPTTPGVSLFRWYRVVETEEEPRLITAPSPPTPGVAARFATLQGGDWPAEYLETPLAATATAPAKPFRPTRAVLMSNVIAVYERTIRLETSGAWTY